MGNSFSRPRQRKPTVEKCVAGLLPIADLQKQTHDIENLVFGNAGAEGFSYIGAVRVLERLCVMPQIKRFSGTGAGAIIATFLAIGFDSDDLQTVFNEYLTIVQLDDECGFESFPEKCTKEYGWNSGNNFFNWFSKLLETKCFDPELTFLRLYAKTDKELCLVLTNVDTGKIEYCHPKTTPDLTIKQAVFMSISTPGIFAPAKYGQVNNNYYLNGNLVCSYPIHCFDGWMLSLNDDDDSLLVNLASPDRLYMPEVFDTKNIKTLGFFPLAKHQESRYQELVNRLSSTNADLTVPRTTLGLKYRIVTQNQNNLAHTFTLLRKACTTLLLLAEDLQDDQGKICLELFATKVFTDKSFTKADRLLFPEIGKSLKDFKTFLLSLVCTENDLTLKRLKAFIETKLLTVLKQYSNYYKTDITNVHSYFATVFDVNPCSDIISKSDYDRTVGILCRHVGPQDACFDDDDQTFLYRQGWNATVAYFTTISACQQTESIEQQNLKA